MNKLIELFNVSKDYTLGETTVHALRNISLSINKGEFTAIAGPSGSGKSTLLNLIGGIDCATDGQIVVNGKEHALMSDREASRFRNTTMGYIFQNFNLIPVLNVYENIEYPVLVGKGGVTTEIKERIDQLICDVGLANHRKHRPDKLSGGQRQRLAIARALVNDPQLVIADEPNANLDQETGAMILDLMENMNKRYGTTFLFSTHSDQILDKVGRIVHILDGEIHSDRVKEIAS